MVTSGFCMIEATSVEIVAGAHNIQEDEASQVKVNTSTIIRHENFEYEPVHNNIALLQLQPGDLEYTGM